MAVAKLRKSLALELLGEEVTIEVDFRLLEIIERVFDVEVSALLPLMADVGRVQRRYTAEVLADALTRRAGNAWSRTEIREEVMTMGVEEYTLLVAKLGAAVLFTLRHMTSDEYDKTMAELAEGQKGAKKKPLIRPRGSSPPATT